MNPTESFIISTYGLSKAYQKEGTSMAALHIVRSTHTTSEFSPSPLTRLAGPIALAAGVLIIIQQLVMVSFLDMSMGHREATMAHPLFVPSAIGYLVAFCGLLIALVAVYECEAERAGIFGVIGFGAALVGTMTLGGDAWFEAFVVPWLANVAPDVLKVPVPFGMLMIGAFTSYVLFASGWVLFAIASLRARAFPVAISVAILVGGVVGFYALVPPFAIPLGVAIAWLGVWMLRTTATRAIAEPLTH